MKGLFIPEITAEMFRNGCLEAIEALMAEGEIYDIDYSPWIPCTERLPEDGTWNIWQSKRGELSVERYKADAIDHFFPSGRFFQFENAIAWMPLPEPYRAESEEMSRR